MDDRILDGGSGLQGRFPKDIHRVGRPFGRKSQRFEVFYPQKQAPPARLVGEARPFGRGQAARLVGEIRPFGRKQGYSTLILKGNSAPELEIK
ncbi:MAG: hypothetical protein ACJ8AW_05635 [Rhodopila sp.]